jgi:hypothetical protein
LCLATETSKKGLVIGASVDGVVGRDRHGFCSRLWQIADSVDWLSNTHGQRPGDAMIQKMKSHLVCGNKNLAPGMNEQINREYSKVPVAGQTSFGQSRLFFQ